MKLYFQSVGQVKCLSLIWKYTEEENRKKDYIKTEIYIQLTLEQHRFELPGSSYMVIFFNRKYCSAIPSVDGWNRGWGTSCREESWLQTADYRLKITCRFSTGRRVGAPHPHVGQGSIELFFQHCLMIFEEVIGSLEKNELIHFGCSVFHVACNQSTYREKKNLFFLFLKKDCFRTQENVSVKGQPSSTGLPQFCLFVCFGFFLFICSFGFGIQLWFPEFKLLLRF